MSCPRLISVSKAFRAWDWDHRTCGTREEDLQLPQLLSLRRERTAYGHMNARHYQLRREAATGSRVLILTLLPLLLFLVLLAAGDHGRATPLVKRAIIRVPE